MVQSTIPRSTTVPVYPISQPVVPVTCIDADYAKYKNLKAFAVPNAGPYTFPTGEVRELFIEHRISKTESSPARAPATFGCYSSLSSYQPNGIDWDSIKSSSVLSQTSNVVTHRTEPRKNARQYWESKCWEMRDRASSSGLPVCRERDRRLLGSLAIMTAAIAIPTLAAATDLTPHLRIGCGFTSVTSAVSLIPLRRDERAGNAVLIP